MRTVESTSDQRKKLVHALSRTALFSDLEAQWLEILSTEAQFCIYEQDESIVEQGEAAQEFFIVQSSSQAEKSDIGFQRKK